MSIEPIIILSLAPIVFGLLISISKRHAPADFHKMLLRAWFFGLIAFIPAIFLIWLASVLDLTTIRSLKRTLFYSFFVVGFFEEFIKYIFLNIFVSSKKVCNSPTRIILASITLSLGFILVENVYFILTNGGGHFSLLEGFLSVPGHIIFGIMMGFFVSFGKFRKSNFIFPAIGLGTATFFHGLFQFAIFSNDNTLLAITLGLSLVIAILLFKKALHTTREDIDHIDRDKLEEELRG
ncbi:MAG: PrsW family glutamic-type intramembrane protease [Bacteroidota bacterium]|nr:PrsW family glutamic-type intramembrane protease [Bacteroidota bacterium]